MVMGSNGPIRKYLEVDEAGPTEGVDVGRRGRGSAKDHCGV